MNLSKWQSCPICKSDLIDNTFEPDRHVKCSRCEFVKYDNPSTATVVLIIYNQKLLLLKRARSPKQGFWDTPGGFVQAGESAEECASREIKEETGLQLFESPKVFGTFTSIYGEEEQVLGIGLVVQLDREPKISLSDENSDYGWFDLVHEFPELAFLDGQKAVSYYIKLKNSET